MAATTTSTSRSRDKKAAAKGVTKPKGSSKQKSTANRSRKRTKKNPAAAPTLPTSKQNSLPPPIVGPLPTLILDTGGWSIKHGTLNITSLTNQTDDHILKLPSQSPNISAKPKHQLTTLLSDQIDSIHNKSQLQLTFPQERGVTSDLGVQFQIWGHILEKERFNCQHSFSGGGVGAIFPSIAQSKSKKLAVGKKQRKSDGCSSISAAEEAGGIVGEKTTHASAVMLLSQPFTPRCILDREDEVWFRDFGFERVGRRLGQCCSAYRYLQQLVQKEGKEGVGSDSSTKSEEMELPGILDDGTRCCCVVDSGFSLTHIVPTVNSSAIDKAIRRINIGGKLLTNHLKELISYRKWNMLDEFYIVNEAKESLCFVSLDPTKEIQQARNVREGRRWFDRDFILPNFTDTFKGTVRLPWALQIEQEKNFEQTEDRISSMNEAGRSKDCNKSVDRKRNGENKVDNDGGGESLSEDENSDSDAETEEQIRKRMLKQREDDHRRREMEKEERQVLSLSIERFAVPEAIFRPTDVGLDQAGLAEAIHQSIQNCDPIYRAAMYSNIVLTGGSVKLPNFRERLVVELRKLAPVNYSIRVYLPLEPDKYAWRGAQDLLRSNHLQAKEFLSRVDWEEKRQSGYNDDDIWGANIV